MLSVCRCSVNERIVLAGPLRKTVCTCVCACKWTALLLIGLVGEREISTLSASPLLHWLQPALSIPDSSISSLCPNLLDALLSHRLAWLLSLKSPFSSHFVFVFLHPPSRCYSISVVLFIPLCIFHQCSCLILICTHFCSFSPSLLSAVSLFSCLYCCEHHGQSQASLSLSLSVSLQLIPKLDCKWFEYFEGDNCH